MTAYARLDPIAGTVNAIVNLTQAQFDALNGNPKQAYLKPLVIDTQPVLTAAQTIVDAGYAIEATQVRQTWSLRNKAQAELDADSQAAELVQLKAMVSAIQTDIDAGITAAPTTQAQAFTAIQDLKRRALRTDRVLKYLLKKQ